MKIATNSSSCLIDLNLSIRKRWLNGFTDLKEVGIEITKKPEIKVQNMVASGSVGGRLNLNEIVFLFDNTEYEPEQFPGLVYKLKGEEVLQNITFLLFGTGKIVITGAKSEKEIKDSVKFLRQQLIDVGELDK